VRIISASLQAQLIQLIQYSTKYVRTYMYVLCEVQRDAML
jgi:hypothetical protein